MIRTRALLAVFVLLSLGLVAHAQERDRARIDDKYKWNLADLYPSDEAWRAAKDGLLQEVAKIAAFKGTLGTSPARLADALDAVNRIGKDLQKVFVYAGLISDQDTRVSQYQGMQQEMQQIAAKFGEETAFVEPEILNGEALFHHTDLEIAEAGHWDVVAFREERDLKPDRTGSGGPTPNDTTQPVGVHRLSGVPGKGGMPHWWGGAREVAGSCGMNRPLRMLPVNLAFQELAV